MSVMRVEKTGDYTIMSNHHFKEKKMSYKAKGLLSLVLSLPEDWDYSIAGLVTLSSDGDTSVRSALDELIKFGYLTRTKLYPGETDSGRIEYDYLFTEKPVNKPANTGSSTKQEGGLQHQEKLPVEILPIENPSQLNTNQLNTNKLNTKKDKTQDEQSSPSVSTSSLSKNTSPKKDSKLFSGKTNQLNFTPKQQKWFDRKLDILESFNLSDEVHNTFADFLEGLAQTNSLLPDNAIQAQLSLLKTRIQADKTRLNIIRNTIAKGWKSITYEIDNIEKYGKAGFDTASQVDAYADEDDENIETQWF